MSFKKLILSDQEKSWLLERKVRRVTDNKEVQIYPMGAERYLFAVLRGHKKSNYNINAQIVDKNILIIPGFGTTAFLFAQAGARSITVYDKDPVTVAWVKAFKRYYHFREVGSDGVSYPSVGDLLAALTCWYPPCLTLPSGYYKQRLLWLINPQALRRLYIFYILALVQKAITANIQHEFELHSDIQFYVGDVAGIQPEPSIAFDTAFVPYLLGVKNGIESEQEIAAFMHQLMALVPEGRILVNPSRNTKEFYILGKRYFTTTPYSTIQAIPALQRYAMTTDHKWFGTQGLTVFSRLDCSVQQ